MNSEMKQPDTSTVSLCWLTAGLCIKPVTAVFRNRWPSQSGMGGVELAWVTLSICPLENSPELLETITAPVEEIAITISDGKEGAISTPGIQPDL